MKECQLCKKCYADEVVNCPSDGSATVHTIAGAPVLEGKYHIECRIGQGGMGVVYKARHSYLKTLHAIKVILPDLVGNDPQLVTRFRQEALAAAAIRHMNVVGVSDYGVISGTLPFLVMEYVEGESLHDLLAREKSLSAETSLELMSAICAGVGAAHHQGIVHRDLKPLNIMICKDKPSLSESVKILDFGLAKIKSGELLGSFIQAQTTGLMGSPYYMAPEQWADDDLDSRSDIYSLGVMLFQMLAGDVPFKGSSIPAIMKKHISDPPPTFAELGKDITPDLETAIRHTLQKDPKLRTPSVEALITELRSAILPTLNTASFTMGGQTLPVSSLSILTRPPQSSIFVDNVSVGQSRDDGWLMLEGVQSGNHHLRVSHTGFSDWLGDVICDGKPQQVVAELKAGQHGPGAGAVTAPPVSGSKATDTGMMRDRDFYATKFEAAGAGDTIPGSSIIDESSISVGAETKKAGLLSPLILGIIGICGLLLLGIVGIGGAYMLGFIGRPTGGTNNNTTQSPKPSPSLSASPGVETIKADMVEIPGGTFKMGRNEGDVKERPEHAVTVNAFAMDRTEVTNEEYLEFVVASGRVAPSHWVSGRPIAGTEKMPVRFVSLEDAEAFAKWRSERDGVTYRLPTEEEWEYAARNGDKGNIYPWGNDWKGENAVMGAADSEPATVGSKTAGKNMWGVVDLLGNVWEWTSTEIRPYPGSSAQVQLGAEKRIVVRGGSAHENPAKLKITSTFRADVSIKQKEKNLGFRLVRSG
jgi:eukaryotic-like serine/threonine-protein kinase